MAPPVGWERVARAAGQFEARLRRAIIDWAESVQRSMTVDQIVEEIRSGRVEEVFAAAITAAETAAMFAVFTEMTRAAARMSAGIVFDEYGPSLPGRYGPAGGAYPTSGTAGPFTINFARIDQAASDWAAVQWREVWAGITDEAQRSIRAILVRAPIEGISVYEQARLFRSLIGLDARQWQGALNRQAALIARLQGGMSAAAYRRAAAQYDRWVARQLRIRAMRIARTESLRAARWSQLEAFRAARDAGLISGAARWEWGAQPDACDICRELDGTTYSIDEWGPDTHPNCLPGGSLVTPCGRVTAVVERAYDGDLVVVLTAGGKRLCITPNHPVLTRRGWVAAGLLVEGDDVVCGGGFEGTAGDYVYGDEMPAPIEQVAEAFRRSCKVLPMPVPVAAVDFHGDGEGSKVAVVWADRLLRVGGEPPFVEHVPEPILGGGDVFLPADSPAGGAGLEGGLGRVGSPNGVMGGGDLGGPLLEGHARPLQGFGLGLAAGFDAGGEQPGSDRFPGDAECIGESLLRYAGEVSFDKVVSVELAAFHGPLFNLETSAEYYQAEGIIVHNCRCWQTSYFPGDEVYEQHRPTFAGKSAVAKPLGRYADFDACVSAMSSKLGSVGAARRYCGRLQQRIEGGGPDG